MASYEPPLDLPELWAFGEQCRLIALDGLEKTPSKTGGSLVGKGGRTILSSREIKKIWRAGGKIAARKAAAKAPKSGKKNEYTWTKDGKYSYTGKHGDLGLMSTYKTQVWKSGGGFFLQAGNQKSERAKLQVLVGRMAGFNVRRVPGGTATTGPMNRWIQEALNETLPTIAGGLGIALTDLVTEKLVNVSHRADYKKGGSGGGSALHRAVQKNVPASPWG